MGKKETAALERRRRDARRQARMLASSLRVALDDADGNVLDVRFHLSELEMALDELRAVQRDYSMTLDDVDYEGDADEAYEFLKELSSLRRRALRHLEELKRSPSLTEERRPSSCSTAVALPKLELPKFSGNVMQWQEFWQKFEVTVDKSDLPAVSKMTYLQSVLQGEAKACVEGLPVTAEHYITACEMLKKRFGRRERIVFSHIQALLNTPAPTGKQTPASLWRLHDDLQKHVKCLEAVEVTGRHYGVVLTPVLLTRLPADIRLEWAREGNGHEDDLEFLMKFLSREIERRERSNTFTEEDEKHMTPWQLHVVDPWSPYNQLHPMSVTCAANQDISRGSATCC
jgi:hypothetical protein